MGKGGKKGRITSSQRKDINDRAVTSAMDGDAEDVQFGRVLRHLGSGHIRVILDNQREGIAKIRTVLSKRGSTPIVADDIVVLSGRDFETKTTTVSEGKVVEKIDRFDVLGVLTRQQAVRMEKEGRIPAWFIAAAEDVKTGDIGEAFEFGEESSSDSEMDVDAI
jgi:translation initiation factor IF-1